MSGLFWEADRQPNICEAASGFTFSTINLLIAIPMFLLDTACSFVLSVAGLVTALLAPVMEYVVLAAEWTLETLGLDQMEMPVSRLSLLIAAAVIGGVWAAYRTQGPGNKAGGGSWCQFTSKLLGDITGLLGGATFLMCSDFTGKAAYPRLVLVSLAYQDMVIVLKAMWKVRQNYAKVSRKPADGSMEAFSNVISNLLGLGGQFTLVMGVFGYPSLDLEQDTVQQYFCLLPFAVMMLAEAGLKELIVPPAAASEATNVNGDAVAVQEKKEVEPIAVEAEDNKAAEAEEKEAAPAENNAEAAKEEAQGEEKAKADEEEKKTEDATDSAATDKASNSIYVEKMTARILDAGKCLVSALSPVISLVTKVVGTVCGLPWAATLICLASVMTPVLSAHAWFVLTSTELAYGLAVLAVVVPKVVDKLESANKISLASAVVLDELTVLGSAYLQFVLATRSQE